jgi:hypothetical protein
MAIIVTISSKGLYLESALKNNSNVEWDDYLKCPAMVLANNDQILTHRALYDLWGDWLLPNFDTNIATMIDEAVDEIIYQSTWSLESGISGALPVSEEVEQIMSEKLSLLPANDFISLSIVP